MEGGRPRGGARGEAPGAGENLFVLLRAEPSPRLLAALHAPRRAPCPAPVARPGPAEGARAPRPPDPSLAPRAGHLCQVGLSSRRRQGPLERQQGAPGP